MCVNLVYMCVFKLAFEDVNRKLTGNHVSWALMAAMAVHAGATAVCADDSDNCSRIACSFYFRFLNFQCDFCVFLLVKALDRGIGSGHTLLFNISHIIVRKPAAFTNVGCIHFVTCKSVTHSSNIYKQIS